MTGRGPTLYVPRCFTGIPSVETKHIILDKSSFYFQGNAWELINIWEMYGKYIWEIGLHISYQVCNHKVLNYSHWLSQKSGGGFQNIENF